MSTTTLLRLPDLQGQSFDVYFRYDEFGADTHSPPHTHAWGQLNYAAHGVMQLEIDGQRFLSPPQYAVWIPPERVHSCYNSQAIVYRSLYLSAELSRRLPATPCTLAISAILKAILSDFAERGVNLPTSAQDLRLARSRHGPAGMRPAPRRLPALRPYPGAARGARRTAGRAGRQPLAGAMGAAGAQHRANPGPTLPARTGHDLRRMAPTPALPRGHRGAGSRQGIQQIAFDLGYSSPSAFISMFRRLAGTTPEQYRLASRAQDMPML